jgi:hypothetical protein
MHPLVAEAMKKAAVAWLGVADRPPYAVWCLWVDGALYVVSGPAEQPAPGLAGATAVEVSARGDHGGRIVTWRAGVTALEPGSPEWDAVAPQVAGKRLNSTPAAQLLERWQREAVLSRLVPLDDGVVELPDGSLAAVPVRGASGKR